MIAKSSSYTTQPAAAPARTTASKSKEQTRRRECVTCDIPPFCRTNYFTGRLLTEQDFTGEQRYFRDKFRLHYRALHGCGVVCGLRVKPHPYCPNLRLIVEPGIAIDECGYEIVVPSEVEIELPRKPVSPPPQHAGSERQPNSSAPNPYAPSNPYAQPAGYQQPPSPGTPPGSSGQPGSYTQGANPAGDPHAGSAGQTASSGQGSNPYAPPQSYPQPYSQSGTQMPIYVCLQYAECDVDFMPAPFDECGCNGERGRQPGRVCESYTLALRQGTPGRLEDSEDDCEAILLESLNPCPTPRKADCIPLAFLDRYCPGDTVTDDMIDNRTYRPLLPSTQQIDRLLRCLLKRVPGQALTRVEAMGWTHGQEYTCADFLRFFTGQGEGGPAFEVTFDQPVRRECLTPRVFQALVTRFRAGGTHLEIAPSRVWSNKEGTSYYLQIDRDYAQRELAHIWFDVYLTLRCNLVLDQGGRPVDGELIAHVQEGDYVVSTPTGNGVPGGSLESWIRVRP